MTCLSNFVSVALSAPGGFYACSGNNIGSQPAIVQVGVREKVPTHGTARADMLTRDAFSDVETQTPALCGARTGTLSLRSGDETATYRLPEPGRASSVALGIFSEAA